MKLAIPKLIVIIINCNFFVNKFNLISELFSKFYYKAILKEKKGDQLRVKNVNI